MIVGARRGKPTWLRRLMTSGMTRDLRAIVVPGLDVGRAQGLDLGAAGLRIAVTPRHANVLLLVGPIPTELRAAAAVLYAQMMRPRAIFALGCGDLAPLPNADWSVELSQQHLPEGVAQLRKAMAEGAFQSHLVDFTASILEAYIEYTCSMHPEIVQDAPGSCPKCGMTLIPRESVSSDDSGHDHMKPDEADMNHADMNHSDMNHSDMNHSDMNHSDMNHGDMAFMSMVEVTKDMPRSPDGLPMDWIEVPFGPVFPGLPGGLLLTLTLDGDSVAKAHAQSLVGGGFALPTAGMEAARFIEHLGAMHPLAPVAYRLLACRALEMASGQTPDEKISRGRVAAFERERIASHLGWLAILGCQIGYAWLERHAAEMQFECLHADLPQIICMRPAVNALAGRLAHTPLLRSRLSGIGVIAPDPGLRGPVARAAGMRTDARTTDPIYNALSFEVTNRKGGDALARLHIRLDEMLQSFALIEFASALNEPALVVNGTTSGEGHAMVETPRGEARLHLKLDNGRVMQARLDTPSTFHMSLLPKLLSQQELGDALTTVCSLDISPWEIMA